MALRIPDSPRLHGAHRPLCLRAGRMLSSNDIIAVHTLETIIIYIYIYILSFSIEKQVDTNIAATISKRKG